MKLRYLFAALLLSALPVSAAQAGIFVSIAPPPLVTYEQPLCPNDGYLWTPGYWAYDYDAGNYYWVNGVWVPPPRVGYLWTPGYWGFNNGGYVFNDGYWGPTVGFYGGINYGYGYGGYGYGGGRWEGRSFRYNTAVSRVNTRVVRNTYVDRNAVRNVTSSRTSFNGRGGINARPDAMQLAASRASHIRATSVQTRALTQARATHAVTARRTATNPARTANVKRNGSTLNPIRNAGSTARSTRQITRDPATRGSTSRTRPTVTRDSGRNGFNNRTVTRSPQVTRGPQVSRGPQVVRGPQVTRQPSPPQPRGGQNKKDEKKR